MCMVCLLFLGRTSPLYLLLYAPRRGLEAVFFASVGGRVPLPSFVALSLPRLVRFAHLASYALGLRFALAIFLTPNPAPLSRVGIVAQ